MYAAVASSMVNPSITTSFSATIMPCGSVMWLSDPARVLASTPACAPHSVTVLLMVRGPAAASGYVPAATAITSPTWASPTANWIVLQVPLAQQPLTSEPVVPLTKQFGVSHADAAHGAATAGQ